MPAAKLDDEFLEALSRSANSVEYLSIDPGESCGVTGYNAKYELQFMMTIHHEDVVKFLRIFSHIKKCIAEDYRIYSHKAQHHIHSNLTTVRIIGRIESWAENNDIVLVLQPASIKLIGYKWAGQKPLPKSNPNNHSMDAHIHFIHWGVKSGVISLLDLLKDKNDRSQ